MALKPKRKTLPQPTVFINKKTKQWVCEYPEFDEEGKLKFPRKSFRQVLRKEGKEGTLEEQKRAANDFKAALIAKRKKEFNLSRAEREQRILSARELNEAKAAFAILAKLPKKQQSLIEAAKSYVANCKPVDQSPKLYDCFRIFLANYDEKDPNCQYKFHTVHTMHSLLGPFEKFMMALNPEIKIGEVTERHVIDFIKSRDVKPSTRKNYLSYVKQFFDRFSSPDDKSRFIEANPARSAHHYFRHNDPHVLKSVGEKKLRMVKVLQYEGAKNVLQIAHKKGHQGILGYAVLAILTGMRPSEIYDLEKMPNLWDKYIKLDEGVLNINGFGKQSDQRTIDLEPIAVEWLRLIREKKWPICYGHNPKGRNLRYSYFRALALMPEGEGERYVALRRRRDDQKEISDEERAFLSSRQHHLEGENVDIFRHTYGTNLFYKVKRNLDYVTDQMGNSDAVYYKHYKGKLDHPKDHEKFFKLGPSVVLA